MMAYLLIASLLHKFTAGDILRMTAKVRDWRRDIPHIPDFHLASDAIKTLPQSEYEDQMNKQLVPLRHLGPCSQEHSAVMCVQTQREVDISSE